MTIYQCQKCSGIIETSKDRVPCHCNKDMKKIGETKTLNWSENYAYYCTPQKEQK